MIANIFGSCVYFQNVYCLPSCTPLVNGWRQWRVVHFWAKCHSYVKSSAGLKK